jgi:hypothetical protein
LEGIESLDLNSPEIVQVYTVQIPDEQGDLGYTSDNTIMIDHRTLPGGEKVPYNLGRTLAHEVGHWLGLEHPFEGGCSFPNDGIHDTAPQRRRQVGCPTGSTVMCPTVHILDENRHVIGNVANDLPVVEGNFMDYVDDSCMSRFIPDPGQIDRMHATWQWRLTQN